MFFRKIFGFKFLTDGRLSKFIYVALVILIIRALRCFKFWKSSNTVLRTVFSYYLYIVPAVMNSVQYMGQGVCNVHEF